MAADGNGDYTRALGLELDARGFGMGMRGQRFALVIEDGVVKQVHVEAPGEFKVSSAEHILGRSRHGDRRAGLVPLRGPPRPAPDRAVDAGRPGAAALPRGLGAGTEEGMQQAIRVQANFTEYVPFAVLLLVLPRSPGCRPPCMARDPAVASRCCTRGLSRARAGFGRFYGTAGTWLVIVALSLWLVRDYSSFSISGTSVNRSPTRP